MKYKGIELKEFTSDKPVVFNPARPMIVWDDNQFPEKRLVEAYLPGLRFPVILPTGRTVYCAEIPDKMKPKRMTNRQLAEWLAMGNGEKKRLDEYEKEGVVFVSIEFTYEFGDANLPVDDCYFIRRWNETEWHEPTVDFFDKDCRGLE